MTMVIDPTETLLPRLEMLKESLAETMQSSPFAPLGPRLGNVRTAETIAGRLLVEALDAKKIPAPPIDHRRRPWLGLAAEALDDATVIGIRHCGVGRSVPPMPIIGAVQTTIAIQQGYEVKFQPGSVGRWGDTVEGHLHRHVLLEAERWLPLVSQHPAALQELVLQLEDGSELTLVTDWFLPQASAGYIHTRELAVADAIETMRQAILRPPVESKTEPEEKRTGAQAAQHTQALPGRDATEIVLTYQLEKGCPITVRASGARAKHLRQPPRPIQRILQKALDAAIKASGALPEGERTRLSRAGFEPGVLAISPGGSRGDFLGWWNASVSDGDALIPGGKKNVYLVNWRMALASAE